MHQHQPQSSQHQAQSASHATPTNSTSNAVQMKVGEKDDIFERQTSKVVQRVSNNEKVQKKQEENTVSQSKPKVQAKLKVNQPNDRHEQEADATAVKVMRMTEAQVAKADTNSTIQRKGSGVPEVSSETQSAIQNPTGGQSMTPSVQRFMENRFQADFSSVKIHNDTNSAHLSNQLGAKAFTYKNNIFFNRNTYQPENEEGRYLLAHELTHVIQQGQAVQREPLAQNPVSANSAAPSVQRFGVSDALNYFADKAYNIPGFRMFSIVLGVNPINMRTEDSSAANILRAIVEFLPGGNIITRILDNYQIFEKAGAWIEGELKSLGISSASIKAAINRFLDSLGWSDIFNLGSVWDRAKIILTDPISRIIAFIRSLFSKLMSMVREAVLKPLAGLAQGTRGYDLLKAVLGQDPITGEAVPRTADTLIGGFMKLIGQEEVWENLKKGNAVSRAWAWFQGALAGVLNFVKNLPTLIFNTLTSIEVSDFVSLSGLYNKVIKPFVNFVGDFISWAGAQVLELLKILFSVVAPGVMPYITKAAAAFSTIVKNPIAFVGNLVRAGRLGFEKFANNFMTHLKTALIRWITGPLGEAGVYIPRSFSLIEIIKLVLSVLGLTWQNIRSKLVRIIPEPVLSALEKTAGILVTLITQGPVAAWEQIKTELSEMKDQMIAQVTQMISTEVVKAAVMKLVSMLNPAGAVIQAIIAIYNTVTFFIEKANQIAATVAAFIDSIAAIASGNIATAANRVESTLANTLTLVISFLAKFVGLGGIPQKVVGLIRRIRQPIDKGMDKIVGWLGGMLRRAAAAIASSARRLMNRLFPPKSFSVDGEPHRLYPDNEGEVMVATTPKRLADAVNKLNTSSANKNRILAISRKLQTAKNNLKNATVEKRINDLTSEIDKHANDIVSLLVEFKYGLGTKKKMDKAVVNFDIYGNATEFKRQIRMQHESLNQMKVGDWRRNRGRFIAFGRESRSVDSDESRIEALSNALIANVNTAMYLSTAQRNSLLQYTNNKGRIVQQDGKDLAKDLAKRIINNRSARGLAVLHTVDQVAGGDATIYGDNTGVLGNSLINSSIGSQWSTRIAEVDSKAVDVDPNAIVNVELNPR